MLDEYGFEIFEENAFPIAYLLTFRTYGTWLHGDVRGSYQRRRDEPLASITVDPNTPLHEKMAETSAHPPIVFSKNQRELIGEAITEVCRHRAYDLRAMNVRTNHVHAVIAKQVNPKKIVNDLKAYSTRRLRNEGEFTGSRKIWTRGSSTRYLWKPKHLVAAIEYVLYSQGDVPFGAFPDH